MRLGARKNVKALGEFKEEGTIVSVKMFDYSAYMKLFESKLYSDLTQEADSPRAAKRPQLVPSDRVEPGNEWRKVLVFSQQYVEQDKVFKGGAWYQNPFYLIDKITLTTEIEHMGVLPESQGGNDRTLLSSCDNQGNLVAVAVNSIHKIYC